MPQYTARDESTGKVVTFEWSGSEPPTDEDMADVFAEAQASSDDAPERTWTDTAVDALPMLGGLAGGILGSASGPGAIAAAGLGAAGGEAWKQNINRLRGKDVPDTMEDAASDIAWQGAAGAAGEGGGRVVAKGLQLAGRGAMRGAFGAQAAIRRKFPTVDLEAVALREGVGLPGANIAGKTTAAHEAVSAAGRAADDAGATPIQPREMVTGLRKLYDRAVQTRRPDAQHEIVQAANAARHTFRGGVNIEDALAIKSDKAAQASAVMQGAANPRSASTAQKILGAESRAIGDAAKARSPKIAAALTKSQEMMALDKALKNLSKPSALRLLIGAGAGSTTGVTSGDPLTGLATGLGTLGATSPQGLSLLAQLLAKSAPASRHATRGLAQMMASHNDE